MSRSAAHPVIVALDKPQHLELAGRLCGRVAGFKVGLQPLLAQGLNVARKARGMCPDALWVADVKAADVGHVLRGIVDLLLTVFDKVIAHSFVGFEGALEAVKDVADRLVLVAFMSHPGSQATLDRMASTVVSVIERLRPWGLVAPATRPHVIRWLRGVLSYRPAILAPGVGPQGARPGDALCAGADYEIVGRLVTEAPEPERALEQVVAVLSERVRSCGAISP